MDSSIGQGLNWLPSSAYVLSGVKCWCDILQGNRGIASYLEVVWPKSCVCRGGGGGLGAKM